MWYGRSPSRPHGDSPTSTANLIPPAHISPPVPLSLSLFCPPSAPIVCRAGQAVLRAAVAVDAAAADSAICRIPSPLTVACPSFAATIMPHRRLSSAGTCEVVPLPDELPCPQRGFGERPRLCGTHRKEYGRLTAEYKATSEQADCLYALVRAQDWSDEALWNLADVGAATDTASRCVEVINREIRERQEHHRRFFVERTLPLPTYPVPLEDCEC